MAPPSLAALMEDIASLRRQQREFSEEMEERIEELEKQIAFVDKTASALISVVKGDKEYQRRGLIDDIVEFRAFMDEIKGFRAKAVGIGLFISAVVLPAGIWAFNNLDFIQHLLGKK